MNVLCLSLSPCLQRILTFPSLAPGRVNRAAGLVETTGGKGLNVARVLRQLGAHPLVVGFSGGATGRRVDADLRAAGIACSQVRTRAPTRICQTLLDRASGKATELVEEAPDFTPAEWKALRARFDRALKRVRMAVISGNLPPGAPADLYAQLAQDAARAGVPVVIDSSGEPLRRALAARPRVAKLNEHELEATVRGRDREARARRLLAEGADYVCVTAGADGLWGLDRDGAWHVPAPRVRVANPTGCGDAVTAGLVHGLLCGASFRDALALGAAAGAEKATRLLTWEIRPAVVLGRWSA